MWSEVEMGYQETSIVLIENENGEFLVLRRTANPENPRESRGKWVPPGGHVERDGRDRADDPNEHELEAPKRAVIRETFEETGLDISKQDIVYITTFKSDTPGGRYLTRLFHVKLAPGTRADIRLSENQPAEEHDMYRWMKGELIVNQVMDVRSLLRDPSEMPRGRHDYTGISWEIVERGLIPHNGGERVADRASSKAARIR